MQRLEETDPKGFKKSLIQIERLTRKYDRKLDKLDLHLTPLKPVFLKTETWIAAQRVKEFTWRYMVRLTWFLLILAAIHFISYSDLVKRLFSLTDLFSDQYTLDFLSDTFSLKRASFLFIVFGAWIPFVTILALLSNRYQFPIIAVLIIIVVGLTLFVGDGHDIRVATISGDQRSALRSIDFAYAVKVWKISSGWDAKGCERLAHDDASALASCPRPIIVAGEGGGSRAAFLLASVLGVLEDDSLDKTKHPSARPFHNQLFAISGVSGSSVGAAFFIGALKARPTTTTEKLKKALFRQRLWFPNVASANPERANENAAGETITREFLTDYVSYKDALQAALSNDFLSPVSIAYLSRDVLMLSRLPFVYDRAGILEISWEDAFDAIYGTTRETSPLSAPLQTIAPAPGDWTPLLFLNATSNETGRRIVVTPVHPTNRGDTLFADAYDLHELLCSPYRDPQTHAFPKLSMLDQIVRLLPYLFSPVAGARCDDKKPISIDVRLSTAAGASSRAPLVTPHGNIRDRRAQIVDSVVDGGYFDNSGVVTALEVAQGLKSTDPRLKPFILQVSSEPDWFKDSKICGFANSSDRPKIPDQADFRPLGTLTDVLTVNSTRIARSYETILELPARAKQLNDGLRSVAQINVCPQPKESFFLKEVQQFTNIDGAAKEERRAAHIRRKAQKEAQYKSVSVSWWLSPPLQAFLDAQIYSDHNRSERDCVISLLEDRPSQPCR